MTSKCPALEEKKDIVRRHARLARVRRRGQRDRSTGALVRAFSRVLYSSALNELCDSSTNYHYPIKLMTITVWDHSFLFPMPSC